MPPRPHVLTAPDPSAGSADALSRLLASRPMTAARWGLERIRALLDALGRPEREFAALHIAGTNGKGSTAAFADAVLRAHGRSTGLYTSPHLVDVRERVRIDARLPDEDALQSLAARIDALEEAREATYFEVTTALAFALFARAGVEWAVVETGLGGRLDATNALDPEAACVTTVGRDHADLLGDTLEKIAREKAGIFKRGVPAVIGEPDPVIAGVLVEHAAKVGAPVRRLGRDAVVSEVSVSDRGTAFTYRSHPHPEGLALATSMVGAHQAANAGLAVLALESAGVALDPAAIAEGLERTRVPGRFEIVEGPPRRILDIAHNREAVAAFLSTARAVSPPRPWIGVVSILRDKPWEDMVDMLRRDLDDIILTRAPSAPASRGWETAELVRRFATASDVRVEPDFEVALAAADELSGGGTVFITGSAHTVGDARGRTGGYEEE